MFPIYSCQHLTLHVLPTHFRECSSNTILAHLPISAWLFPELPLVTLVSSILISVNSFMVSKYLVIIRTDNSPWDVLTYLIISADTGEQLDGCGLMSSAGIVWKATLFAEMSNQGTKGLRITADRGSMPGQATCTGGFSTGASPPSHHDQKWCLWG